MGYVLSRGCIEALRILDLSFCRKCYKKGCKSCLYTGFMKYNNRNVKKYVIPYYVCPYNIYGKVFDYCKKIYGIYYFNPDTENLFNLLRPKIGDIMKTSKGNMSK